MDRRSVVPASSIVSFDAPVSVSSAGVVCNQKMVYNIINKSFRSDGGQ